MVVRTTGQVEALGNGGYTSAGPSSVGGKRESWEMCESCRHAHYVYATIAGHIGQQVRRREGGQSDGALR